VGLICLYLQLKWIKEVTHMTKPTIAVDMAVNVSKRINVALDGIPSVPNKRGRITAAAQLFNESHQSIRLWLNAGPIEKVGLPDIKKIPAVAKILDVNIEWLLTGEGEMRPNAEAQSTIDREASGEVMRFIHHKLVELGFFELAIHKQDTIFSLIYETIKGKRDGISEEFSEFVVTTLNAMKD